ncbi:unnamed protein product [Rotaria sp. Silwood1]|nr:unnamed protein product [Rotaria sp. Silwood1]
MINININQYYWYVILIDVGSAANLRYKVSSSQFDRMIIIVKNKYRAFNGIFSEDIILLTSKLQQQFSDDRQTT